MSQNSSVPDQRYSLVKFQIPLSMSASWTGDLIYGPSKSEYVRCLHLRSEDVLYVATNNGYLYLVKFFGCQDLIWTKLVQVPGKEVPIICMDLLSRDLPKQSNVLDDWVAFGDGKGNMTVARVFGDVCFPEVDFVLHWSAEKERQLLGTYWCKALGHRFIFTSDPRGNVQLWQLVSSLPSVSPSCAKFFEASLVAEFSSCLGFRIMCLDASFDDEVLVCGDLRGNLVIFPLLKGLLLETTSTSGKKISSASYFKGAHGISTVSSVSFARLSSNEIEICSIGGDGCICFLEYDKTQKCLEFVGMKQVKELSLIESVVSNSSCPYDLANCGYAVGFTSTDFIVLNLTTEARVVQVPCGGWRRPHSFYPGDASTENYCFVYVKEVSRLSIISVEITHGLERILMLIQLCFWKEMSTHYLEHANVYHIQSTLIYLRKRIGPCLLQDLQSLRMLKRFRFF